MPRHDIEASFPAHRVINSDLSVIVKSDGKSLGELLISKGSLDWRPSNHKESVSMRWETFAKLMKRYYDGDIR